MREAIFFLALASANSGISLRVVEPLLPRLASDFGVSISAASIVITAFGIASAIGSLLHGPLGDRFGKLRMATVAMAGAGAGSIACAFAPDIGALALLRFVTALFGSASVTLGMAYIGDRVPLAERQQVVARFVAGTISGQALGPFLGGLLTDLLGWRGSFLVLGGVFAAVAAILLVRTRPQWHAEARGGRGGINPLAAHARLLGSKTVRYVLATALVDSFLFFGAYSFVGAFLKIRFELSLTLIGAILAGFGVGGVLYTLSVGPLLRSLGQRGLVTWGGAICAAAFALIVLTPVWPPAMFGAVVLGFSFYMLHNTVQTKATEMAPQSRGAAVAIYASCWSLGQALGVAAMGVAAGWVGYAPAIIAFGLGFAALGLWMRDNLQRLS
jgi:predicted MFS family arabinose efflux permease